jgi:prepilin-type N-terminal cleavage/methylation domain-containing protein
MNDRNGFTLIELVVVIMIATVILATTVRSFGDVGDRRSVVAAQSAFESLHARARAHAIERGTPVRLNVDGSGDSVWLETDSTQLEMVDFKETFGVDLQGYPTDDVTLCMSPRGFADTSCNTFSSLGAAFFMAGDELLWAAFLPLGQLVYPDSI